MNEDLLRKNLAGKLIGHNLYYYPSIGSTNEEAYRLGAAGAAEGTVVIADRQTKGKGRMQRIWHSPAGGNIYTSFILRPSLETGRTPQLTLLAGVAAAEVLDKHCEGKVELKWPNDILIGGKKVCGILSEMKMTGGKVEFVVIGIGINVNINVRQFSPELRFLATSLREETGRAIAREDLLISLYENIAKWYKKLLQEGFAPVKEKWLSLAAMIGRDVQITLHNETVTGRACGIDDTGSL
ncbi:MAG TPA: biotin--[acetyl-CoA-carboxylase] ligase, partial [Smithellaceae bacterium]|nr:biotin--[acetyl-CoA-carboxylase] ligase [Smithellaceae bacterium]